MVPRGVPANLHSVAFEGTLCGFHGGHVRPRACLRRAREHGSLPAAPPGPQPRRVAIPAGPDRAGTDAALCGLAGWCARAWDQQVESAFRLRKDDHWTRIAGRDLDCWWLCCGWRRPKSYGWAVVCWQQQR